MSKELTRIDEVIEDGMRRVALMAHTHPDGDAAGAVLGLSCYLSARFPKISFEPFLEPLPREILFLAEGREVPEDAEYGADFDLALILDCSDLSRVGGAKNALSGSRRKVQIDHHETNTRFADLNVVFPYASSTCEILTDLTPADLMPKETAVCYYTGIVHDTGVFRYDSTAPSTLRAAADLIQKGIPFDRIIRESIVEKPLWEARVTAKIVDSCVPCAEDSFLYALAPLSLQRDYGVNDRMLGNVVTALNEISGFETVCFMYQYSDGSWKGSLRSKEKVNVATVASLLGGGGHARAAGFSAEDPEQALETIRKALKEGGNA